MDPLPEPVADLRLAQYSGGEPFDGPHGVMRIELQSVTVASEKQARNNPSRALVAVNKRVITNNSVSIGRGQCRSIGTFICGKVARAGQSRIKRGFIANSGRPTVFSQLAIVDGVNNIVSHPSPALHFDNARSTSRSSCMIASASIIWRSNSGS